jgi:hypothetical protein
MMGNPVRAWRLRRHLYPRIKAWPRLSVVVVLLALLPCPQRQYTLPLKVKRLRCTNLTNRMDASDALTLPAIWAHRSPALPHHLHQFPRLTDCGRGDVLIISCLDWGDFEFLPEESEPSGDDV